MEGREGGDKSGWVGVGWSGLEWVGVERWMGLNGFR